MKDEGQERTVLIGALMGAGIGALVGVLLSRSVRRRRAEGAKPIKTTQWVRFGVSLMPSIRQLLDLLY